MQKALIFLFLGYFCCCSSQSISIAQLDSIKMKMAESIQKNYIVNSKIPLLLDSLRTFQGKVVSADSFEKAMNANLFKWSNDKHLFLQYRPVVATNLKQNKDIHKEQDLKEKRDNYGFEKPVKMSSKSVIVRLKYFAYVTPEAKKYVYNYFKRIKKYENIILDFRGNLGGSGSMMQLLSGMMLSDSAPEILAIDKAEGKRQIMRAFEVPSSQKCTQKLYILIDSQTFSAGEGMPFILKNRNRATLVGENTAGAGNVGGPYPLAYGFILNIPIGLLLDPLTQTGWEQIGVQPHVICESKIAVNKTLELILQSKP